jgi:hypothetical protein
LRLTVVLVNVLQAELLLKEQIQNVKWQLIM